MKQSTLGPFLLLAAFSASAAPSISVQPIACLTRDHNARISALINGPVRSARVYFRGAGSTCGDYFVEMHRSASNPLLYWAVLPVIAPDSFAIIYRVKVDPGPGAKELASEEFTVAVKTDCVAEPLSADEQRAAQNIVLGLTSPAQKDLPCAFRCNGITSILTAANELRPNEACRRLLAATKWPSKTAIAAGVGAGAAAAILTSRSSRPSPSPARP